MSRVTCKRCCYWDRTVLAGGRCRRNSPASSGELWPETREDDWCGQATVSAGAWSTSSVVDVARRALAWWDDNPEVGGWLNGAPEWVFSIREALARLDGAR